MTTRRNPALASRRRRWTAFGLSALIMLGGTAMLVRLSATRELGKPGLKVSVVDEAGRLRIELPERVLDYTSTNVPPTESELNTLPEDTTIAKRHYTAPDGFGIALNAVMMGTDRTSIHKPEFCLTSQGWQIMERATIEVPMKQPHSYELPVREFRTRILVQGQDGQARALSGVYLFWFVADGRLAAGHFERLAKMTWDLFRTGTLPRWAYVSCFASCPVGSEDETSTRMKQFMAAAVPIFQVTSLPEQSGR